MKNCSLAKYVISVLLMVSLARTAAAQDPGGPTQVVLPDEEEGPTQVVLPDEEPPPPTPEPSPPPPPPAQATPPPPQTSPLPPPSQGGYQTGAESTGSAQPYGRPIKRTYQPSPAEAAPADTAPTDARQPQLMEPPKEEQEEEEKIFGWFSVAPEVGYVFYPRAEMYYRGFTTIVEPRNGFIAKLHFDIGGDGLAFEIAPLFAVEAGGIDQEGYGAANVGSLSRGGSFQALGGQVALVYRFELGYFFPNLGLSFHGTYLMGSRINYGTELYGRLPVGFTVYMGKNVGFVFEVGFMYGVTGIRTPIDWENLELLSTENIEGLDDEDVEYLKTLRTADEFEAWWLEHQEVLEQNNISQEEIFHEVANNQLAAALRFGQGFGIDITIGLRFP